MKLTAKPLPKAKKNSRGSTSTQPTGKASSFTLKKEMDWNSLRPQVILEGVQYSGIDSQGTAVDTAHQKQAKNSEDTALSCAIIATTDLSPAEKVELKNAGVFLAQMKWLKLFSNCIPFNEGVALGEGVVSEMGANDDTIFAKVVLYREEGTFPNKPIMVEMNNLSHLNSFVGAAAKDLLRRGIMR
jgi:hypothetical protein